jgi:hypothetical protein
LQHALVGIIRLQACSYHTMITLCERLRNDYRFVMGCNAHTFPVLAGHITLVITSKPLARSVSGLTAALVPVRVLDKAPDLC